jgi:hypothetical protein
MSRAWFSFPVLLCLPAACGGDEVGFSQAFVRPDPPAFPATSPSAAPQPTWTVLVYGHGDNDLSNSLLSDLAEMASAALSPGVQLLVFADWNASRTIAGGEDRFPAGAIWYRVPGQGQPLERFAEGEELDFDDPAVLSAAVTRAFREFPADRHGLVLWDHGGAWSVGFGGDSQDGTRRESSGLSIQQLAAAIESGLDGAGLTGTRPLEFLSIDACLMGGAESITAFQDLAQVYLADAELDYGDGWDYAATLGWLSENRSATARELGAFEVAAWDAHHREASLNDALLRSHVAIDTSRWPTFVSATRQLVQLHRTSATPGALALGLQRSLPAYRSQISTPRGSHLRDLGDVLSAVASGPPGPLTTAAGAALAAGQAARIAVSAGSFRGEQLGVHVFGGPPLALSAAEVALYPRLAGAWAAASGWGDLIGQLRAAADGQAPGITGSTASAASPDGSITVGFEVTGGDVARVEVSLLKPQASAGPALVHGTIASAFVQPGRYELAWNGHILQLSTGATDLPVTVEPWIWQVREGRLEAPILASRGVLRAGGEDLECTLLVDAGTLQAPALVVMGAGRAAVYDLPAIRDLDPQAVFLPTAGVLELKAGVPATLPPSAGVMFPESGTLALRQSRAQPGGYLIQIRASDVWGNERATLLPVTAR